MTSPDAAIGWVADNYLGTGEPYPPNYGEWIPWQEKWGYPAGFEVEWCGGLWMEAIRETGGTVGPNGTVPNCWYTVAGVQEFMRRGDWYPADGTNTPQRGDLVFFTWNGTGFITAPEQANNDTVMHVECAVDPAMHTQDGSIVTYGGNVSERCGAFRRYDDTSMVGFGRPRWGNTPPPPPPPSNVPTGAIGARWAAIGGPNSVIGNATGPEKEFLKVGRTQAFQRGAMVWTAATGAWEVYGDIGKRWWAGGGSGQVGMPLGPEMNGPVKGSRWQRFQKGYLYWHPSTGRAQILKGAILMEYLALPQSQKDALGVLLTDERDARVSLFQNGRIAWEKSGPAWTHLG